MSTPATKIKADLKSTPAAVPAAEPPSVSAIPAVPAAFDPDNIKIKRVVTVPQLKLRAGDTVYVKALKKMYTAKEIKNKTDGMPTPTLLDVVDLKTGQLNNIVVSALLYDIFEEEYPADSYVGKGFKIVVGEQKAAKAGGGRRYNQYEVYEIEI